MLLQWPEKHSFLNLWPAQGRGSVSKGGGGGGGDNMPQHFEHKAWGLGSAYMSIVSYAKLTAFKAP